MIPKILPTDSKSAPEEIQAEGKVLESAVNALEAKPTASDSSEKQEDEAKTETAAPPPKAWSTPKAWSGFFTPAQRSNAAIANGNQINADPTVGKPSVESLAESLKSFSATSNELKVAFLEPRGLVNTGNMCYMNSVLQVLVFCLPFYNFLDQCGKRSAHSFKSETPLIDAM